MSTFNAIRTRLVALMAQADVMEKRVADASRDGYPYPKDDLLIVERALAAAEEALMVVGTKNQVCTVERRPYDTYIERVCFNGRAAITARSASKRWGDIRQPDGVSRCSVNWCACGDQPPEEAVRFALGIILAAKLAEQLPVEPPFGEKA